MIRLKYYVFIMLYIGYNLYIINFIEYYNYGKEGCKFTKDA
jgi:hypothetical protein